MPVHGSVGDVLEAARQVLEFAKSGYRDFLGDGERQTIGLHTAVTNGRSVTFVLQNLRSKVDRDEFEAWYEAAKDRIFGRHPEVGKWFVDLRNQIEKQGTAGPMSGSLEIPYLNTNDLPPAPPNAVSTFIGDACGRSGWIVELPDGSETRVYFKIPGSLRLRYLMDAPNGWSLEELLQVYLADLEELIQSAAETFATD